VPGPGLAPQDGRVALDLPVDLPRPRRRGDATLASLEGRILDRLFDDHGTGIYLGDPIK
jgi:sulfonate transport system ATP-binding protein